MDVQMPEMGGFEATAAIRAREQETGGHIRIVAMTAHAMNGDRERCVAPAWTATSRNRSTADAVLDGGG
jgi:CheY-like chemotaxis protein